MLFNQQEARAEYKKEKRQSSEPPPTYRTEPQQPYPRLAPTRQFRPQRTWLVWLARSLAYSLSHSLTHARQHALVLAPST